MTPARRTDRQTEELRASLLAHARRLVTRSGAGALTMRALAAEAGCAVGLPYKVFASREELVAELIRLEYAGLRAALDRLVAEAGRGSVGENLGRFADVLLATPALALAAEIRHDRPLSQALAAEAVETGLVAALPRTVERYLAAEKELGRVAADVDEVAFGFVIAGAVHNLLISGPAYPRPEPAELKRLLAAVADRLMASQEEEEDGAQG